MTPAGVSDDCAFAALTIRNAEVTPGENRVEVGYSSSVPSQIKFLNSIGRTAPTHGKSDFKLI